MSNNDSLRPEMSKVEHQQHVQRMLLDDDDEPSTLSKSLPAPLVCEVENDWLIEKLANVDLNTDVVGKALAHQRTQTGGSDMLSNFREEDRGKVELLIKLDYSLLEAIAVVFYDHHELSLPKPGFFAASTTPKPPVVLSRTAQQSVRQKYDESSSLRFINLIGSLDEKNQLRVTMLLSKQSETFDTNMVESVEVTDLPHIDRLLAEGSTYEDALLNIFHAKYGVDRAYEEPPELRGGVHRVASQHQQSMDDTHRHHSLERGNSSTRHTSSQQQMMYPPTTADRRPSFELQHQQMSAQQYQQAPPLFEMQQPPQQALPHRRPSIELQQQQQQQHAYPADVAPRPQSYDMRPVQPMYDYLPQQQQQQQQNYQQPQMMEYGPSQQGAYGQPMPMMMQQCQPSYHNIPIPPQQYGQSPSMYPQHQPSQHGAAPPDAHMMEIMRQQERIAVQARRDAHAHSQSHHTPSPSGHHEHHSTGTHHAHAHGSSKPATAAAAGGGGAPHDEKNHSFFNIFNTK